MTGSDARPSIADVYHRIRADIQNMLVAAQLQLDEEVARDKEHPALLAVGRGLHTALQKWKEQRFQIAVLALTKSGKSTLLNAMLGREYLPSSIPPETASIVRIRHRPDDGLGTLHCTAADEPPRGAEAIRTWLRQLNADVRRGEQDPVEQGLILEACLVSLEGRELGDQGFDVLDTPGPNEAEMPGLSERVERLLDQVDVIVYVLDYTKLKTAEEANLFKKLKALRPELLEQYSCRLCFVVNKIDLENRNAPSREDTTRYVLDLLAREPLELNVPPERLFLISAEDALLARLILSEQPTEDVQRDFVKRFCGRGQQVLSLAGLRDVAPTVLSASGVPQMERAILGFLYEQRGRLLLQSLLGDIERHLDSLANHVLTAQSVYKGDAAQSRKRVDRLKARQTEIKRELTALSNCIDRFNMDIREHVKKKLEDFKARVRDEIQLAARQDGGPGRKGPPKNLQSAFWFGESNGSEPDKVEQCMKNRNDQIGQHLRERFEEFRLRLERELRDRQAGFYGELTPKINRLRRKVEEETQTTLELPAPLYPVDVELPILTLEEMREDIQEQIKHGVSKGKQLESYTEKFLCWDVTKQRSVTFDQPDPKKMAASWLRWIDARTKTTEKTAMEVIDTKVTKTLQEAHRAVEDYAAGFVRSAERECDKSTKGEQQRETRLREIDERRGRLQSIREQVTNCREYLDRHEVEL